MSFMTLRVLRAGSVFARSMAAAALRVSLVTARSSAMTGPTSSRMFSVFTPALYPTAVKKTTTSKTATKKKAPIKKVAAKSKSTTTSKTAAKSKTVAKSRTAAKSRSTTKSGKAAAKGRKPKTKPRVLLTAEEKAEKKLKMAEKAREALAKKRRAEIRAIPKPPPRRINPYSIFMQKEYANQAQSGVLATETSVKVASAWRALSETERQQYKDQAAAIKPLYDAQYEKWAKTVGYQAVSTLNRSRALLGKQKLHIPDAMRPIRPARKTPAYIYFYTEKLTAGEFGQGLIKEHASRAGKLWRQMSPAEKTPYEARSAAEFKNQQASQA